MLQKRQSSCIILYMHVCTFFVCTDTANNLIIIIVAKYYVVSIYYITRIMNTEKESK